MDGNLGQNGQFFAESLAAEWSIRQGSILQWHRFSDGQETQGCSWLVCWSLERGGP